MLDWKHLQLSSEDYQNFINNEDEEIMEINEKNISEWQYLYVETQKKTINNKNIKRAILIYQNHIKRLTEDSNFCKDFKESKVFYNQHSNQLKNRLAQLYQQLGMLHLNNISTTVELIFSRLLKIEEDLIGVIFRNEQKIQSLENSIAKSGTMKMNICSTCQESIEKIKFKMIKNEIMVSEEYCQSLQDGSEGETESQKIRRYLREDVKREDHLQEIQRYNYIISINQALKNRERTLRCTNTPLQSILTDYLQQMLCILEQKKISFAPKNIKQFDRVSRSYEKLQDMKKLVNFQELREHVQGLLERPFSDFEGKLQKMLKNNLNKHRIQVSSIQTQTYYVKQFDLIQNLQKQIFALTNQVNSIRTTKIKLEGDIISNLQASHKYEMKLTQLNVKNKQYQAQVKKLEQQKSNLRQQLSQNKKQFIQDRDNLISTNLLEKNKLIQQKRKIQNQLKRYENDKNNQFIQKNDYSTQTENNLNLNQSQKLQMTKNQKYGANLKKEKKKGGLRSKSHKRISIRINQSTPNQLGQLFQNKNQQNLIKKQSNFKITKQLQNLISPHNSKNTLSRQNLSSRLVLSRQNMSNQKQKMISLGKKPNYFQLGQSNMLLPQTQQKLKTFRQFSIQNKKQSNDEMNGLKSERQNEKQMRNTLQPVRGHRYNKSDLNEYKHLNMDLMKSKIHAKIEKKIRLSKFNQRNQFGDLTNKSPQIHKVESNQQYFKVQSLNKNISNGQIRNRIKVQSINNSRVRHVPKKNQFQNIFQGLIEKSDDECLNHQINSAQLSNQQFKLYFQQALQQFTWQNQKIQKQSPQIKLGGIQKQLKIEKESLSLFFDMQGALKYQKNVGLWSEIDNCIMIDNKYSADCDHIDLHFINLKSANPEFYRQCMYFLSHPYDFFKNGTALKQIGYLSVKKRNEVEQKSDPNWIKSLFKKLFTIHKLIHKKCSHVSSFLESIGLSIG